MPSALNVIHLSQFISVEILKIIHACLNGASLHFHGICDRVTEWAWIESRDSRRISKKQREIHRKGVCVIKARVSHSRLRVFKSVIPGKAANIILFLLRNATPFILISEPYLAPGRSLRLLGTNLSPTLFLFRSRSPLLRSSLIKIHFSALRQADKQGHNFNYGVKPGKIGKP